MENMDQGNQISVIIPYYNGMEWISRSLSSVLAQTLPPHEIVIVDDGSKEPLEFEGIDNIPGMENVIEGNIKLNILRNEVNRGIPATRNIGIKSSTGEWIAFLDQDDEWMPEKLEAQMCKISRQDNPHMLGGIFSRVLEKNLQSGFERTMPRTDEITFMDQNGLFCSMLWKGNIVHWITFMVHRICLEKVGYLDEKLKGGSDDYDFVLRVASKYNVIVDFDKPRAIHYLHGKNYSNLLKFANDNNIILSKMRGYCQINSKLKKGYHIAKARNLYNEGRYWHIQEDYVRAWKLYLQSIIKSPEKRNLGMLIICTWAAFIDALFKPISKYFVKSTRCKD
jgi:glycosyltransferase involved in cell wall biosynthesis